MTDILNNFGHKFNERKSIANVNKVDPLLEKPSLWMIRSNSHKSGIFSTL